MYHVLRVARTLAAPASDQTIKQSIGTARLRKRAASERRRRSTVSEHNTYVSNYTCRVTRLNYVFSSCTLVGDTGHHLETAHGTPVSGLGNTTSKAFLIGHCD